MKHTFTLLICCILFLSLHARADRGRFNANDSTPPSPPHIAFFTPTQADSGSAVYIYGQHFNGATGVYFGGVASPYFIVSSDTLILAQVGYGASGSVTVFTPYGSDSLNGFTFLPPGPKPVVTAFTPHSGKTGDTIFIWGRYFTGATAVSFGGAPSPSYHVLTDTTLWAVVGNGATCSVSVYNRWGAGSLDSFTYIVSPPVALHLLSFSPDSARTNDTVFIHGSGLTNAAGVYFGGTPAGFFAALSDSLLLATVGAGSTGSVFVTSINNGSDSLPGFVYIPNRVDTTPPPPPADSFKLLYFAAVDSTWGIMANWTAQYDQGIAYYILYGGPDSSHVTYDEGFYSSNQSNISNYHGDLLIGSGQPTWWLRLTIVDTLGDSTHSPAILVRHGGVNSPLISSRPNPVTTGLLTVNTPSVNAVTMLVLSDQRGNIVRTVPVPPNTTQISINVSGLNNGIYTMGYNDGRTKTAVTILIAK